MGNDWLIVEWCLDVTWMVGGYILDGDLMLFDFYGMVVGRWLDGDSMSMEGCLDGDLMVIGW